MGENFLKNWFSQIEKLGNTHLLKVAKTIQTKINGMLSYFKHRITTDPLEGLNNKIKVLKRQSYGYRVF